MKDDSAERLLGRLKALRIARGLTQEEFAEKSGFSYKYYQALEAGRKRNMRLETLDRLAKAMALKAGSCCCRRRPPTRRQSLGVSAAAGRKPID